MTEKLYEQDSHIKEFSACVLSCQSVGDKWQVVLDRTAFFPEGGGQLGDTGEIDGVAVLDTQTADTEIYHLTGAPLQVGKTVHGKLNWEQRFRRMQNHSGEHIISGLIHNRYGFENVGFHMGHEDMTVDLNGFLSPEQLSEIEREANRIVWKNVPVKAEYPNPEDLKKISYRSKLDFSSGVRLVTIEGVDVCACCAPHVGYTGEIGLIKIVESMRYKGGVRIHLLCGEDALEDICEKTEALRRTAAELSAKQKEVPQALERERMESAAVKRSLHAVSWELVQKIIERVSYTDGNLCLFDQILDQDALRELVNRGMEKCAGLCAVFSGNDKTGYFYIIGSKTRSVAALSKEINMSLNGRGGGRDPMIQGSVNASKKEILQYFKESSSKK